MALCENCRAELPGPGERLPAPWFDHDVRGVATQTLTKRQWRVLEILWRRRHTPVVSVGALMTLLYADRSDPPQTNMIRVTVCQVRKFLEPTPYRIELRWGEGYQLVETEVS